MNEKTDETLHSQQTPHVLIGQESLTMSEDEKKLEALFSCQERELKAKEEELESTKMDIYHAQEYGEKIDVKLEDLRRNHLSKTNFKDAERIIWDKTLKVINKIWDHLELIQEKIETIKMARWEMIAIKNFLGDSPTKDGVIIDFLNHMPMEEVFKGNIDRSMWVERSNQLKRKKKIDDTGGKERRCTSQGSARLLRSM